MSTALAPVRQPVWSDMLLWFETTDAILRGLGHSLNNRALALSATVESLDPRRAVGAETASGLTRETEKLTDQLRLLRALPFAVDREPMPLLLHDVLTQAVQLHRAHASLGDLSAFVEGTPETPPVLAPESAMMHALLVTLTALKRYAAPGGLVRLRYSGTPERADVHLLAQRVPGETHDPLDAQALVPPMALSAALLGGALLEIEQRIGPREAAVVWTMPSLRAMRRKARGG
jgi:hypothetical protein